MTDAYYDYIFDEIENRAFFQFARNVIVNSDKEQY